MVMARLLSTSDFGLIAIVQSIMGVSVLLGVSGIGATLVTRTSGVERAASAYFWFLSLISLAAALTIFSLAAPITELLGIAEAAEYLRVLAFILPISFMTMVPEALLLRLRMFSAYRAVAICGSFTYFAVEIVLVLRGWGVWSVVVGQLSGGIAGLMTALVSARWMPKYGPSFRVVRTDLGNLGGLGLNSVFRYLYTNLDYWAVSRVLGAGPLGAYYIAYVLPSILRLRLADMFRTVMLPLLSGSGGLRHPEIAYGRAFTLFMFISLPSLVGLAVLADPIVAVLFGPQWDSAVVPMRIIIIGTILDLVIQSVATFAVARRRVAGVTWSSGLRVGLTLVALCIVLQVNQSTTAVAMAVVLATAGTLIFQEIYVAKPLGVQLFDQWRSMARITAPTAVMAASTGLVVHVLAEQAPIVSLLVGVPMGVAIFTAASLVTSPTLFRDSVSQFLLLITPGRSKNEA
jgi:lipopolysaccharide exporter